MVTPIRVDADHVFDVASRRSLSSATAAPHWAALEVADVSEDENPVVEEARGCDENTPVDDVVKSPIAR